MALPAGTLSHLGLRETKKRRQRESVERAALDLFVRHGYEQTTVQDICDAAEVGHATFYRYFPTKEDVVFPYRDHDLDALTRLIRCTERPVPPSMIHNVMVAFAGYLAADDALPARDRLARSNARLSEHALTIEREWEDTLARAIAAQAGDREPDLAQHLQAAAAMVVLRVARAQCAAHPAGPSLPERVDASFSQWDTLFADPKEHAP
jgi:AcrR family transcriptional regulator